jgi:Raf kinase inhibitor-like YbhB/YbcL family protein
MLDDPDAPSGTFTHWILYNIPSSEAGISGTLPERAMRGLNSGGRKDYFPPCPPAGTWHRYVFHLFALDAAITPESGERAAVQAAMQGHVIAEADLTALFRM